MLNREIYMPRKIPGIRYVTQFAKTQHNDVFLEIQIFASVSFIYIPKALFCSNINAVLGVTRSD